MSKTVRLPDPPRSLLDTNRELYLYLVDLVNRLEITFQEEEETPRGWTVTNLPTTFATFKVVDGSVTTASSISRTLSVLVNDMLQTNKLKGN